MTADEKQEYIKVPGARIQLSHSSSLHMGQTHLLKLVNVGYSEDYRRYYYTDIQSLIAVRTSSHSVWSAAFVIWILTWISFIPLFSVNDSIARIVLVSIGGIGLLFLIINLIAGPTCKCYIRTAVSCDELPSLKRIRHARKAFEILNARIQTAQQHIEIPQPDAIAGVEGAQTAPQVVQPTSFATPPTPGLRMPKRAKAAPRFYNARFHELLLYLLVWDVIDTIIEFGFLGHEWTSTATNSAILLAMLTLCFLAAFKQHNSTLPKFIQSIPWLSIGLLATQITVITAYAISGLVPDEFDEQLLYSDSTLLMIVMVTTLVELLMIVFGLRSIFHYRNSSKRPPAVPAFGAAASPAVVGFASQGEEKPQPASPGVSPGMSPPDLPPLAGGQPPSPPAIPPVPESPRPDYPSL